MIVAPGMYSSTPNHPPSLTIKMSPKVTLNISAMTEIKSRSIKLVYANMEKAMNSAYIAKSKKLKSAMWMSA